MTIKKIKREITETIIFSIVHLIAANDKRRDALKRATMQFHQKSSYASSNSRQMTTMARMRMRKCDRFHGTCLWYLCVCGIESIRIFDICYWMCAISVTFVIQSNPFHSPFISAPIELSLNSNLWLEINTIPWHFRRYNNISFKILIWYS